MMRREPTHRRAFLPPRPGAAAAGYTFIEVLFAVIILGIGAIMLAGMLPVAIKQSSDTRDEVAGRAVCEAGFAQMQAIAQATPAAFPPTDATVVTPNTPVVFNVPGLNNGNLSPGRIIPLCYDVVKPYATVAQPMAPHNFCQGSRVDANDRRFQYLAFYGRANGSSTARLILLAMRLRNVNHQDENLNHYGPLTLAEETINNNNGPMLGEADFIEGGPLDPDRVVFTTAPSNKFPLLVATPGTFVIVAAATNPANDPGRARRNTGRVFRLGARRTDLDATGHTFDLQSGYDLGPLNNGPDNKPNTADDERDESMHASTSYTVAGSTTATGESVQVWLVGSGLSDPTSDYDPINNPYAGTAQDVGVLSIDLPLSN